MELLFSFSFFESGQLKEADAKGKDQFAPIADIIAELDEIDPLIQTAAPERPLPGINKVDLAVLRLIVFESRHKKTPKKVLVNEGVELAKEYGTDSSPKLVNGVLGKMLMISDEKEEIDDTANDQTANP